jgi:hypothetical protein
MFENIKLCGVRPSCLLDLVLASVILNLCMWSFYVPSCKMSKACSVPVYAADPPTGASVLPFLSQKISGIGNRASVNCNLRNINVAVVPTL